MHIAKLADRNTQSSRLLESGSFSYKELRFSANGQRLVCTRTPTPSGINQINVYDAQTGLVTLVSRGAASGAAANGASDSPDISSDGRFIAYRSAATDILSANLNGTPQIFLYDAQTGTNTLLSASRYGGAANNRSLLPVFSGDGRTLCFTSWASDLVPQDFNQNSDVFAFGFFFADILTGSASGQGAVLSWPYLPGNNYRVQFKDDLKDPAWQDLNGTATNSGNRAWLRDSTAGLQRFYRVTIY